MKRSLKLIVMSLVLMLGLWGYSVSRDNPYARVENDALVSGGPAYDDHPWGGDQGHNNGGGVTSLHRQQPPVSTGNLVIDVAINQIGLRHYVLNWLFGIKTQTNTGSTGSIVTPTQSVSGNNSNSAN